MSEGEEGGRREVGGKRKRGRGRTRIREREEDFHTNQTYVIMCCTYSCLISCTQTPSPHEGKGSDSMAFFLAQ